ALEQQHLNPVPVGRLAWIRWTFPVERGVGRSAPAHRRICGLRMRTPTDREQHSESESEGDARDDHPFHVPSAPLPCLSWPIARSAISRSAFARLFPNRILGDAPRPAQSSSVIPGHVGFVPPPAIRRPLAPPRSSRQRLSMAG